MTQLPFAQIVSERALIQCSDELLVNEGPERGKIQLRLGVARALVAQADYESAGYILEDLVALGSASAKVLLDDLEKVQADPSLEADFLSGASLDAPALVADDGDGAETEAEAEAIDAEEPQEPEESAEEKSKRVAAEAAAAKREKADAAYNAGMGQLAGVDGRRSIAKAIPLLEQAAELGSTDAMLELALWRGNSQYKWYDKTKTQRLLLDAYKTAEDKDALFDQLSDLPRGIRRELQRAVGTTPDGLFGSGTRAALDRAVR